MPTFIEQDHTFPKTQELMPGGHSPTMTWPADHKSKHAKGL